MLRCWFEIKSRNINRINLCAVWESLKFRSPGSHVAKPENSVCTSQKRRITFRRGMYKPDVTHFIALSRWFFITRSSCIVIWFTKVKLNCFFFNELSFFPLRVKKEIQVVLLLLLFSGPGDCCFLFVCLFCSVFCCQHPTLYGFPTLEVRLLAVVGCLWKKRELANTFLCHLVWSGADSCRCSLSPKPNEGLLA